jgi:hypothetical protein
LCLLAYLPEGSEHFADYIEAVSWAQAYAAQNRETMLRLILAALRRHLPSFEVTSEAVNYHHNYVEREHHFGADSRYLNGRVHASPRTFQTRGDGSSGQRFEGSPFHDLLNGPLTTVDELYDGTLTRVKVYRRLRST